MLNTKKASFFNKQDIGLVYIMPWFLGFLIFSLYPIIASLYYTFFNFNFFSSMKFIGLSNFTRMFNDSNFLISLKATFVYVLFAVPTKIIIALLIAMLLNMKLKFINLYRTLYYLPSILGGSVVIGILWRLIFVRDGLFNSIIGIFGIEPVNWLGDPKTAIYVLSLLPVWQVGSSMVIFLAGLKQIPNFLYEAAHIDGASAVRRFFTITLPIISPIILFNLVMQTINAFQEFSSAFVVTQGGPNKSTYIYVMMIYDEAFKFQRMGYASALSWFLFFIILIFTAFIFKTSSKWTFYDDGGDL